MYTLLTASSEVLERAFGAGKVNQAIGLTQIRLGRFDIGADANPARAAHQLARILANKGASGVFQCRNQLRIFGSKHCLNQGTAHAPGATCNGKSNLAHIA
jgi:stage V sporulation protein SpoVS